MRPVTEPFDRVAQHLIYQGRNHPRRVAVTRARIDEVRCLLHMTRRTAPLPRLRCPRCAQYWASEGVCDECVDDLLAEQRMQDDWQPNPEYPPLLMPAPPAPSGPMSYAQRIAARREAATHAPG